MQIPNQYRSFHQKSNTGQGPCRQLGVRVHPRAQLGPPKLFLPQTTQSPTPQVPGEKEEFNRPNSPQSVQALDRLVTKALAQCLPPHQAAEPPAEERRATPPSPYQEGEINGAEAQAEIEAMDPQTLTGEWLTSHEELSATESQLHQNATEPEV